MMQSERRSSDQVRGDVRNCTISKVPIPILRDIFFRLPIKSVTLCRCVCNEWRNIISKTDFSECYIKPSNFKPLLHDTCYYYNSRNRELAMLEISEKGNNCIRKTVDLKDNPPNCVFVGLRNGFICFRDSSAYNLYVRNLITGVCVQLPGHGKNMCIPKSYHFGFNPPGNNFKVLAVDRCVGTVDIFTVGIDDKWRRLSIDTFRSSKEMVFCNGAFNWISAGSCIFMRYAPPTFISTLELGEEKSGRFSVPVGLVLNDITVVLGTFKSHLSLIDFSKKLSISIWFMKEYAVAESWTEIRIERRWIPRELECYSFSPVAHLPDGQILFVEVRENYLISFNVEERKCSRIDIYESATGEGGDSTMWVKDLKTCNLDLFRPAKKLNR